MLGDTHTGKTSLVLRFVEGHFRPNSRAPTVGAFFITKRLQVAGLTCKVQIWDTAGQSQFQVLGKMYYQTAAAAILCYDVSSRHSFDVMKQWLEEVQRNIPAGSIVICICACKADLPQRAIPRAEVEALGNATGALVMETSAKDNTHVSLLYRRVTERVLEYQNQQPGSRPIPVTPGAKMEGGRIIKAETDKGAGGRSSSLLDPSILMSTATTTNTNITIPTMKNITTFAATGTGTAPTTPQRGFMLPSTPPTTRRDKRTKMIDSLISEDPPKMCEPNMMICGIIPTRPTTKECVIL